MAVSKENQNPVRETTPMEVMAVKEEKTLFSWEALERPYQKKDKEFWATILSILGLVSLILFFVKEWFLIAALISLAFLYYVLTTVPPQKTKYRITNKGIYLVPTQRLNWEALKRFWFSEKWGSHLLSLETWLKFPKVVSFVIPDKNLKEVKRIIAKYLPEEKDSPQFVDKFSSWVASKVPIEQNKKEKPSPKAKTA